MSRRKRTSPRVVFRAVILPALASLTCVATESLANGSLSPVLNGKKEPVISTHVVAGTRTATAAPLGSGTVVPPPPGTRVQVPPPPPPGRRVIQPPGTRVQPRPPGRPVTPPPGRPVIRPPGTRVQPTPLPPGKIPTPVVRPPGQAPAPRPVGSVPSRPPPSSPPHSQLLLGRKPTELDASSPRPVGLLARSRDVDLPVQTESLDPITVCETGRNFDAVTLDDRRETRRQGRVAADGQDPGCAGSLRRGGPA